jgi:hypothetical protein
MIEKRMKIVRRKMKNKSVKIYHLNEISGELNAS